MITVLVILLNLAILLLYHLLMWRKVIKPLRLQDNTLINGLARLSGDVRYNNGEFLRRTELLSGAVNKMKSEHSGNIRQNKSEIIKLKSQMGRVRK